MLVPDSVPFEERVIPSGSLESAPKNHVNSDGSPVASSVAEYAVPAMAPGSSVVVISGTLPT